MNDKSKQNTRDAISVLFPGKCVAEVRIVKAGKLKTVSGYFELPEHIDEMVAAVAEYNGQANVYWTINPCNRALLARAANRLKPYAENTTSDDGIIHRNWLPIDFDPVRFAGISSSDEEKEKAREKLREVSSWLTEQGWPRSVKADSGNGYHALYKIDLPVTDQTTALLNRVLKALASQFDDEHVKIDQTTFNASRVLKAYGTLAVKGDDIPERPHRMSGMVIPKDEVGLVSKDMLAAIADLAPEDEPATRSSGTAGGWTAEMVQSGLNSTGFNVRKPMAFKRGIKWQHDCFFNPDHKCPDSFTVLDKEGWVSSKCSHNSCAGKSTNAREWGDAVEKLAGRKIERPVYAVVDKTKYFDVEEV